MSGFAVVADGHPYPQASVTSTPVYVDAASPDVVYGVAVVVFLLAASLTVAVAQLVQSARSS